jgi:RimJ/RimL family protein N-acetyltransferase
VARRLLSVPSPSWERERVRVRRNRRDARVRVLQRSAVAPDAPPVILHPMQGKLVRLRGWEKTATDVDALVRWSNDEEVIDLLGPVDLPRTRAFQEHQIEEAQRVDDTRMRNFAIETLDGQLIGDCGIRYINWISRSAELFITIGEKGFWGKGYGADAVRLLERLAFERLNLNRLWLTTLATNERAIRCYEKCGFRRDGLNPEASYVKGKYIDVVAMGILRRDYERSARG